MKEEKDISHIALIPDGNRRWAKEKGFLPWIGHQAGAKAFEKILNKWAEVKVPYVTFWGGSVDNLTKRPKMEVDFLFKAYDGHFKRILKDKRIHENRVRINVLGLWEKILPLETQRTIKRAIEETKNNDQYFLTFLLAYDGTSEMISCCQKIVQLAEEKGTTVTEGLIKENLLTKDLPPVDLVIRTGCKKDPHLSAGFMMWDTAYSQLYFTDTLFPEFTIEEFKEAVNNYLNRERRLGK